MFEIFNSPIVMNHLVEIIGGLGSLALGIIARQKHSKLKKKSKENELLKNNIYQTKIQRVKELYDIQHFSVISLHIKELFRETPADRFTIMFIINGKVDFNFLTVLYDQAEDLDSDVGGISPYSRFLIDAEFRHSIHQLETDGYLFKKKPNWGMGRVGDYMDLEGLQSIWYSYVSRVAMDQFNDVVVFCSASSNQTVFTRHEQNKIRLILDGKIIPEIRPIIRIPEPGADGKLVEGMGLNNGEE
jgi:hypothetical protein